MNWHGFYKVFICKHLLFGRVCDILEFMEETSVNQMNMLSLAFVGDAVFTLFVRERLARNHDNKAGGLHKLANKYVKATSQAQIFDHLEVFLCEKEKEIAVENAQKDLLLEIIMNMLKEDVDIKQICAYTNQTVERVEELRKILTLATAKN